MTDIYSGQFNGNILLVGRTGCGKTTFLEKLAINRFFGDIIKTEWVRGIEIDTSCEAEIQSYFNNETEVHVATDKDELDALIDNFKLKAQENNDKDNVNLSNSFGEIKKWIVLLFWMTSQVLLTYQKNLQIFQQFPESMDTIVFMFFTLS